ncbi:hypothetical protein Q4578_19810 [Shimia thalassica]|uniref:hypothetical protein n=1 Tax=Shimia thalassica TaxID=1715693 RepID=UPI0026E3287A|nr:hypothetical protein [Shimia thalassica]MDO6523846.1 hypothetical protein [Shimia thalassica]
MDKRLIFDGDICSKFILPALIAAGCNLKMQISKEKTLTAERIILRGKIRREDYVL